MQFCSAADAGEILDVVVEMEGRRDGYWNIAGVEQEQGQIWIGDGNGNGNGIGVESDGKYCCSLDRESELAAEEAIW
jgi:hypothetical protein